MAQKEFIIKVHESYRNVIAMCDKDVKGKFLSEENMQLDLSTAFFDGEEVDKEELDLAVSDGMLEDATFYIAGEKSVKFMLSKGIIEESGVKELEGIPFALVLL